MTLSTPTVAYDLELLKVPPRRGAAADNGWCFGLPPGISVNQWPPSPWDGHPMQPGFTLKLPGQYRARGSDYVAITMFADQQYEEPHEIKAVAEYLAADTPERPADPNLLPYWMYKRNRHPMEVRMQDIIGHNFAAIWLTEAEFAGPLCQPPRLAGNPLLECNPPPAWLEVGTARAYFDAQIGPYDDVGEISRKYVYRLFDSVPEAGHHAYGIELKVRQGDPNVGIPPRDSILHRNEMGGYIAPFTPEAEAINLDRLLQGRNHLGGTMFPCQWTPRCSATYLEFAEHFGGFNFGGGNAQLDLVSMAFDWACG